MTVEKLIKRDSAQGGEPQQIEVDLQPTSSVRESLGPLKYLQAALASAAGCFSQDVGTAEQPDLPSWTSTPDSRPGLRASALYPAVLTSS